LSTGFWNTEETYSTFLQQIILEGPGKVREIMRRAEYPSYSRLIRENVIHLSRRFPYSGIFGSYDAI